MSNFNPMSVFIDLEKPGYRAENHYFSDMAKPWGLALSHAGAAIALDEPQCHYVIRFSDINSSDLYQVTFGHDRNLEGGYSGERYVFQIIQDDLLLVEVKMLRGEDFDDGHDDYLCGISFEILENAGIFSGSKCLYDIISIQAEKCRLLSSSSLEKINDGNKL